MEIALEFGATAEWRMIFVSLRSTDHPEHESSLFATIFFTEYRSADIVTKLDHLHRVKAAYLRD